ncbi:MAG: AAA family ATPase [Streptosporangiaceae bacterium]
MILPYCYIIGQRALRQALEISYVSPAVGGVLAAGHRGTAKSTTVRAFARMMSGKLPVTLPIGATDDRVLGGWRVENLMASDAVWQPGLIEEAGAGDEPGMLYIDEVNLLDDHLTDIILDSASTGILVVQRESAREAKQVDFCLVGTMNPEEGNLRPQLLDRFGLLVWVKSAQLPEERQKIVETVLKFEEEVQNEEAHKGSSAYIRNGRRKDETRRYDLAAARGRLPDIGVPDEIYRLAGTIAAEFELEGHRGELVMLRAARALAAIESAGEVMPRHVAEVAPMALAHRRLTSETGPLLRWSEHDDEVLAGCVAPAEAS